MSEPAFVELLRTGEIEAALQLAGEALRDGADTETEYAANLCFARVAAAEQDWNTAEKALRAAIMLDTEAVEAPILWAQVQLDQGRPEKAIYTLSQVDQSRARQTAAWYKLQARLATSVGDAARTVGFLQKALDLDPDNKAIPMLLATSMAQAGQLEEAADYMLTRCRQEPNDAAQWRVAASLQSTARGPGEALKVLLEASDLCADPGILMQLLSSAAVNNAFNEVRANVDKIKKLAGKNPELRRALGAFYLAADKTDQALHQFEKAYAQNPDLPDLRRSYAAALLRKAVKSAPRLQADLRMQALGFLDEQLCFDDGDWRIYNDLAAVLINGPEQDRQRAAFLLDSLLDKDADLVPALVNRAALYAMNGQFKDARSLAKRAVKLAEEGSLAAQQAKQLLVEIKAIKKEG